MSRAGRTHILGRSCGNRHCPTCQQDKTKAWLETQTSRLLPCPYFLLTFTIPAGLRDVVRRHQRIAYAALLAASSAAIKELATNPRFFGTARCGFFGVLHTWGRTLEYHPHVHYVVPGGALSDDGTRWVPSRADFFLPVKALSVLFRASSAMPCVVPGWRIGSIRRYGGETGWSIRRRWATAAPR